LRNVIQSLNLLTDELDEAKSIYEHQDLDFSLFL